MLCSMPDCEKLAYSDSICRSHFFKRAHRLRQGPPQKTLTCEAEGCDRKRAGRGYCTKHYQRLYKHGSPEKITRRANGTGSVTKQGYRRIRRPGHPNASSRGYIAEHRFVMAEKLGRPLFPDETVHHRNGVRCDNDPENLELKVGAHSQGLTLEEAVAWAKEILRRYAGG